MGSLGNRPEIEHNCKNGNNEKGSADSILARGSPEERGSLPQTKMLLLLMPFKQKEGKRIKIIRANSFASMGLHIK